MVDDFTVAVLQSSAEQEPDQMKRINQLSSEIFLAALDSHIIVLPELSFPGYTEYATANYSTVSSRSQYKDGYITNIIQHIAKQENCYVVFGYSELGEDGLLYNSAAVITPTGQVINTRKKALSSLDYICYSPPDEIVQFPIVVPTQFGRLGVLFDSDECLYSKGDIDTLIILSAGLKNELINTTVMNLQSKLCCNVIYSSLVGRTEMTRHHGSSFVCDRFRNITKLENPKEISTLRAVLPI
jgi:hypothetical protein